MNPAAQEYWNEFWQKKNQQPPAHVTAWQFGSDPDHLAQLVIDGIKTATCSGQLFYDLDKEPLPAVDDYSVVLNSKDEPVAIIRTSQVDITPMNEVTADFARAEGEGDLSYEYWHKAHVKFFTDELRPMGLEYKEDMPLVCEHFELIDVKK